MKLHWFLCSAIHCLSSCRADVILLCKPPEQNIMRERTHQNCWVALKEQHSLRIPGCRRHITVFLAETRCKNSTRSSQSVEQFQSRSPCFHSLHRNLPIWAFSVEECRRAPGRLCRLSVYRSISLPPVGHLLPSARDAIQNLKRFPDNGGNVSVSQSEH